MRCGQGSAPDLAAELTDLLAGLQESIRMWQEKEERGSIGGEERRDGVVLF